MFSWRHISFRLPRARLWRDRGNSQHLFATWKQQEVKYHSQWWWLGTSFDATSNPFITSERKVCHCAHLTKLCRRRSYFTIDRQCWHPILKWSSFIVEKLSERRKEGKKRRWWIEIRQWQQHIVYSICSIEILVAFDQLKIDKGRSNPRRARLW